MKKSKILAVLCILAIGLSFSSCTKDENEDGIESSGGSSSSSTGYVFYKNISALELKVVNSKVSSSGSKKIEIYKKNSSYYHKKSGYYLPVHTNTKSTHLGVPVSSYKRWSLYTSSSVNYYYYFNI